MIQKKSNDSESKNEIESIINNVMSDEKNVTKTTKNVTKVCRQERVGKESFLKKCKSINIVENRFFTYLDFPNMKRKTFNKKIERLGGEIINIGNYHTAEYVVKGVDHSKFKSFRHQKGNAPSDKSKHLEMLFTNMNAQKPAFHKITMSLNTNLYDDLVNLGLSVNDSNRCISVNDPSLYSFSRNTTFRMNVYPSKAMLYVGCTFDPIYYDSSSLVDFIADIGAYRNNVSQMFKFDLDSNPISDWTMVDYHLNKDSTLRSTKIADMDFHFSDFTDASYRLYGKDIGDTQGRILREEQFKTSNTNMVEFVTKMSNGDLQFEPPQFKKPSVNDYF